MKALIAPIEALARPFARCIAYLRNKGGRTEKMFTFLLCLMMLGPLGVLLRLAGLRVFDHGEWYYAVMVILPMILAGGAFEIVVHRVAKRPGGSARPSSADWLLVLGAPLAGPILFLIVTL